MDDIFSLVASQLALDYSMPTSFLLDKENHFSLYTPQEGRRAFEDNPDLFLKMAVFNGKIVATGKAEAIEGIKEIVGKRRGDWIFDCGSLERILNFLKEKERRVELLHPFLVKGKKSNNQYEGINYRVLEKEDIAFYKDNDDFSEAFAFDPNAPDEVGVEIIENGVVVSVSGASADSPLMWQIGINTKSEFSGKGYGKAAVDILSDIVLDRGKIPYYGTAFSHLSSMGIALASSFRPLWTELISN